MLSLPSTSATVPFPCTRGKISEQKMLPSKRKLVAAEKRRVREHAEEVRSGSENNFEEEGVCREVKCKLSDALFETLEDRLMGL
jgi:hypothetical protein